MYNPMLLIKNKKLIISFVLLAILIIISIFVLSLVIFKYNPAKNSGSDQQSQKKKTTKEIIDSLTAPVSGKEELSPVSNKVLDSLTAPVNSNNTDTGNTINEEVLQSLTAPAKK